MPPPPKAWIFFDCESSPDETSEHATTRHIFRCACATHVATGAYGRPVRTEFSTADPAELWRWVGDHLSRRCTTWIVAHNAQYDLSISGFWGLLERGDYTWTDLTRAGARPGAEAQRGICVLGPTPMILELEDRLGRRLTIADTRNWWRGSLAEVGESVGVAKGRMPAWDAMDMEWMSYCRRDVEILEAAMIRYVGLLARMGWATMGYTIAGQSRLAWVASYGGTRAGLHGCDEARALERRSYYCGEFTASYLGRIAMHPDGARAHLMDRPTMPDGRPAGPVHHLDVRSLYPSVMVGAGLPAGLLEYRPPGGDMDPSRWSSMRDMIADVDLDARTRTYPVHIGGATWHCIGRMRTVLCGPELEDARQRGEIVGVGEFARYRLSPVCDEFARALWEERAKCLAAGDTGGARVVKDLMNGLHGKLGEREPAWVDAPDLAWGEPYGTFTAPTPDGLGLCQARSVAWRCQRRGERSEVARSHVAVAAWVASLARQRVRQMIDTCPPKTVYYVASDGLVCAPGALRALRAAGLVADDAMGLLREVETYQSAEIRGIHDYRLGTRRVIGWGGHAPIELDASQVVTQRVECLDAFLARPPDGTVIWHAEIRRRIKGSIRWRVGLDGWTDPVDLTGRDYGSSEALERSALSANANESIDSSGVLPESGSHDSTPSVTALTAGSMESP